MEEKHRHAISQAMRQRWGLKARPVYQACLADLTRVARPLLPRGFKSREEVEAFLVAQSGQTAAGCARLA